MRSWTTNHINKSLVLVAIAGSVITALTFLAVNEITQARNRGIFERLAEQRIDDLEKNVSLNFANLIAVGAFFDASRQVERADFTRLVAPLLKENSALQALEWIPRVSNRLRDDYTRAARQDGLAQFEFTERTAENQLVRAASRDEYYPEIPVRGYW